jgi:hypothetical protein
MSVSTSVVERYQPGFTELEQSTLLGFLAGYRGFPREGRLGPAPVHGVVLATRQAPARRASC